MDHAHVQPVTGHHGHNHAQAHHHHGSGDASALRNAFILTLGVLLIEAIAGVMANSLALLSDAGHILTDTIALGLAWFTTRLAQRPPDPRNTFGYGRSGILAALFNSAVLFVIAGIIGVEAFLRLAHPPHVAGEFISLAATLALAVNIYIAWSLHAQEGHSLNVRAALLHVLGDIGASLGVIVAGIAILLWHSYVLDPVLSFGIALLIAFGAWHIVRDTVAILMEGAPSDVDLERLTSAMQEVPGVLDVHDLHVWSLSDGFRLLSAHIRVPDQSLADSADLLADVKLLLKRRFRIEHTTIELECNDCAVGRRRPIQLHPPESAGDRSG